MKNFDQLVTIKEVREEKAERAVIHQRRVLAEAVAARNEADRRLQEFREHAAREEARMYAELCARVVHVRDIDNARQSVLLMKSEETGHRRGLEAAEETRAREERQLADDRAAHVQARRTCEQFHELADVFAEEARDCAERLEEGAIEESVETRRPGPMHGEQFA